MKGSGSGQIRINTWIASLALILLASPLVDQIRAASCARIKAQPSGWVAQNIDQLIRAARAAYLDDRAASRYERILDHIAGTVTRCQLSGDQDFMARHARFVDYINTLALDQHPDHELGFVVSDRVYFAETRQFVAIPDFLLRPDFLKAVSRSESLKKAKAILTEINRSRPVDEQVLFFSFESRHLGTPDNDNSFRRFLIVVPGRPAENIPEKWVQFGITDPGRRVLIRNLSVVAVVPGAEQTNVYFKDYFRTFHRNGSITIKGRWELGEGDDNCTVCHKSGVLPIFPESGSVSPDEQPVLEQVNERFLKYSRARFDRYLDLSKLGPGLGSSVGLTTGSQRQGSCASCHQPEKLNSLNWPMDETLIRSYVIGGQMPLGFELTTAERDRLYRKLVEDYFSINPAQPGILKKWLME